MSYPPDFWWNPANPLYYPFKNADTLIILIASCFLFGFFVLRRLIAFVRRLKP